MITKNIVGYQPRGTKKIVGLGCLLVALYTTFCIAIIALIIYVAVHFIMKFW